MIRLTSIALLLVAALAAAQTRGDLFRGANELYDAGDYAGAEEGYRGALAGAFANGPLEYNLGNALYRQGKTGPARLHYERAARQMPTDADIRYNIRFVERRHLNSAMREENFAAADIVVWRAVSLFPPVPTLAVGLAAFVALNLLVALRILGLPVGHPALYWSLVIVLSALAAVAVGVAVSHDLLARSESYGVIVARDVEAASEPSADAPGRFSVPEAAKVRVGRRQGRLLEIILPNGSKGWVAAEAVEII